MGEQTKNMLIGVFVVAACGVIIWLILFLKPRVGNAKETLYVRFSNVNQINIGTRVLFAGKPVGEVVAITPIPNARQKPIADVIDEIYYYQLVLKVDSSVKVYDTDEVTIQTSGLLGEKSIAIIPKVPPKGVIPRLISDGQPIYAESIDPLEHAFNEITSLASEMRKTFQHVTCWIQKYGNDMGSAICSFGGAMDEIRCAVATVNKECILQDAKTALNQFTHTFHEVQDAICQMKAGNVFINAGPVMKNLKNTTHNLSMITTDIADGRGTIGRLIKDDNFYLHINSILSKIDTLMRDINNYGLLFYLNKSWQRQRAQKITQLNALDTPENFKRYFEMEVDDINVSMSRLSLLIDKAELSPERKEIMNNEQFLKDFRELMQLAEELSDNLRLFNQQLMDAKTIKNP
jgi:phospholipid/cholesterol/gamma-HCH transport system substrate-binding protein